MAWIDNLARVTHPDGRQLIGASFRGVAFFVESSNRTGGRRKAKHEFIDADDPELDDLGRKGNDFFLTGYVLGDDYMEQRDRLWAATNDIKGPGDLVHPYYSHLLVQVGNVSVSESTADGGMATFQLEFAHAPSTSNPSVVIDLEVQVAVVAEELAVVNIAALEAGADVGDQPQFARASLSADLSGLTEDLRDQLAPIVTSTQELALMNVEVDSIVANASELILTPSTMLVALVDVTKNLVDSIANAPLEIVDALIEAYNLARQALAIGDTDTRIQEREDQLRYGDALRAVLVTEAARIVTLVSFGTIDDATRTRGKITDALDELAATASDETFPSIVNLRSSLLRAIPGDTTIASIRTIKRNVNQPSILISYQLYGNTDSAADIVERNSAQHPAFLAGTLSVLSNV